MSDLLNSAACPDDIRVAGWSVAVHNDYWQGGRRNTFWLFTRGDRAVKGEGPSDAITLDEVRNKIGLSRVAQVPGNR